MMREIKFRAWDKQNKYMAVIFDSVKQEDWFIPSRKDKYTVMQYTGLKDKNGAEIYEGDIIHTEGNYPGEGWYDTGEHDYNFNGVVTWEQEDLAWKCEGYYLNELDCIEIIGNIYENPELLSKED